MISTTTRPVSLTSREALVAKAEAFIASNGEPDLQLVQAAITFSAAHGDPLCDNPYREVLIEITRARRAACA